METERLSIVLCCWIEPAEPSTLSIDRFRFPIDLVACLPVTYVELFISIARNTDSGLKSDAEDVRIVKTMRLMRLAKLLRLARVKRVLERLEAEYAGVAQAARVVKIMAAIIFTSHFVACFWYYVGDTEAQNLGWHPGCAGQTLGAEDGCEGSHRIEKGWVERQHWPDSVGYFSRYLDSFYFSVTCLTTVGFGDRTPSTNSEKIFSIFTELAGCVIFGVVAGSLGALAMSSSMSERELKFQREQLREFLRSKRIRGPMQKEVLDQRENW
jgi:potassium voltage-gated channel Eag-related subfamily H protein 5